MTLIIVVVNNIIIAITRFEDDLSANSTFLIAK